MNVTLTFNVFFGPLAIGLLVGCGSMKNHEFSQIEEKIDLQQYALHHLQNTLSAIDAEQERLGEFLSYVNSPTGEIFFTNARCRLPAAPRTTSMPEDACETYLGNTPALDCEAIGNCGEVSGTVDSNNQPVLYNDLRAKDCSVQNKAATLADQPDEVVTMITGMLCVAGPGKLPLWARIPTPGKVIVEGAMRLTRSFACARTVNSLSPVIDNRLSCIGKSPSPSACSENLTRWKNNEIARLQTIQQNNKQELDRCESIANSFPGLNRYAAQDNWAALESRAIAITADIDRTKSAILDSQAHRISVNARHKSQQEYTPPDPG